MQKATFQGSPRGKLYGSDFMSSLSYPTLILLGLLATYLENHLGQWVWGVVMEGWFQPLALAGNSWAVDLLRRVVTDTRAQVIKAKHYAILACLGSLAVSSVRGGILIS